MLQAAIEVLQAAGIASARLDAQLLLAHVLGITREALLLERTHILTRKQQQEFDALLARRAAREPIAHILGKKEFWGLEFAVTPATLVPRPDSETLITALLAHMPQRGSKLRVLDLGSGTGCLLLAALSEYPQATGLGVDINPEAIDVARGNAKALGLINRAEFKKSDWNSEVNGVWDVVLSNPPYIPTKDICGLSPDVADYEPRLALDGGSSGLDCYRAITGFLPTIMAENGVALLEVGVGQAADVAMLATLQGLKVVQVACDLAGIERCVVITR